MRRKSIFTSREKEFLKNPSNFTKNLAASNRYNIREAAIAALKDLTEVAALKDLTEYAQQSKNMIEKVFTEDTLRPLIQAIMYGKIIEPEAVLNRKDLSIRRLKIALMLTEVGLKNLFSESDNPPTQGAIFEMQSYLEWLQEGMNSQEKRDEN